VQATVLVTGVPNDLVVPHGWIDSSVVDSSVLPFQLLNAIVGGWLHREQAVGSLPVRRPMDGCPLSRSLGGSND
jgi:hypothetical protein